MSSNATQPKGPSSALPLIKNPPTTPTAAPLAISRYPHMASSFQRHACQASYRQMPTITKPAALWPIKRAVTSRTTSLLSFAPSHRVTLSSGSIPSLSFLLARSVPFAPPRSYVIQPQHHHPSRKHLPVERPKKRISLLAFQVLGGVLQTTSRLVCVLPCGSSISTRGTYASLLEDFVHAGSDSFSRCTPCCRGGSSEVI